MLATIAVLGLLAVGTVVSLDAIQGARNGVASERERLFDEYEAFLEFADRVASIQVVTRPDGGRMVGDSLVAGARADGNLQAVRAAYRETVMSVPHFETDYDESLEAHMATELSPELASAVVDGSQFTAAVRRPLLASARSAARDRRVLIDELVAEAGDIEDAGDRLRGVAERFEITDGEGLVDRRFPDLQARWRRLDDLQVECESLLECRQAQLRERAILSITRCRSATDVSTYLYDDLDVDFPVLATATEFLDRIEAEKDHTVDALTRRRR